MLTARLHELEHEHALLKRQVFGRKTERMPTPDEEAKKRAGTPTKRGGHTGPEKRNENAEKMASLPVCVVEHPIPDEERRCPHCGEDVCSFGEGEVSFELEWLPGRFVRRKHVVETGRCRCKQHYARGPAPERVEEGCTFGPGLIAKLVVDKCGDAIPIYRIEKRMRRAGIPLSRSTMNDLLLRAADLLEPLYDVALGELRIDPHLQADETTFRMQGQRTRVFVWAFLSPHYTLYIFSPSRSGETPKTLLGDTTGSLVCDGHSGYNVVTDVDCRTRGGCWCHARRKVFEALPTAPTARDALDIIIDLFLVEREAQDRGIVGTPAHLALRRDKSAPVLNKLLVWMKDTRPLYEPASAMGKAIGYIVNQWGRLTAFIDDPCMPIHNNASESALRIIAMARKSSLFFGNSEAARRLVILYSLVATCEKNGVNPEVYIRDVLTRLPNWPADRIGELLPHRWKERFGTGFATEQASAADSEGRSTAALPVDVGSPTGIAQSEQTIAAECAVVASTAPRHAPSGSVHVHDTTQAMHQTSADLTRSLSPGGAVAPPDAEDATAPRRAAHTAEAQSPSCPPTGVALPSRADPRVRSRSRCPPRRSRAAGVTAPRSPPTRRCGSFRL